MISHNVTYNMLRVQQLVIRLHLSVDALLLRMIIEPSNNELSFQLQPDYTCCLRVMGKNSCIAEIVILSPCDVPDCHCLRRL